MSEKAKLRRCENDLYIAGLGVILFGAWDAVKIVFYALFGDYAIPTTVAQGEYAVQIIAWIVVFALAALVTGINLFIGLNAQRAARGKDYKKGYYVMTIIILVISVLSMITYWNSLQNLENIETTIASILVQLTSIYIYFTIIRSTQQIRQSTDNA